MTIIATHFLVKSKPFLKLHRMASLPCSSAKYQHSKYVQVSSPLAFISLYVQKAYFATVIAILTAIDHFQTSEETGSSHAHENEVDRENKLRSPDFTDDPSKWATSFGFEQCRF